MISPVESPFILPQRRNAILKQMPPKSYTILEGAKDIKRNSDVSNKFRQDSSFSYITGYNEPGAKFVMFHDTGEEILFVNRQAPGMEVWMGEEKSFEDIKTETGIQTVVDMRSYDMIMEKHVEDQVLVSMKDNINELRVFKDKDDIRKHREAIKITAGAFEKALAVARPGMTEYQLASIIENEMFQLGAFHTCFPTIVASGKGTLILHYPLETQYDKNKKLKMGDIVQLDFGAEFGLRGADVSRVFPVSPHFSPEQRTLYEIVADVQDDSISCCFPNRHFNEIYLRSLIRLTDNLIQEKVIKRGYSVDQVIGQGLHQYFYPHGLSHFLGMDVHDVGRVTEDPNKKLGPADLTNPFRYFLRNRRLQKDMLITVEPGAYINPHPMFNQRFVGIGMRIEDDVLITDERYEVLTSEIPKGSLDIQKRRNSATLNDYK